MRIIKKSFLILCVFGLLFLNNNLLADETNKELKFYTITAIIHTEMTSIGQAYFFQINDTILYTVVVEKDLPKLETGDVVIIEFMVSSKNILYCKIVKLIKSQSTEEKIPKKEGKKVQL